ncbi:hypothetical protein Cgig2_000559 [Carnegiea gigantea]|uniref:Uncharacterized protein n=1 Tax=Carnegiea gigantea TaxID=171969 RepID=A0A9Q1GNY5_9CARY|nr:hypothetical protein Cgig2_000559 [Carnegiea gigantea]
MNLLSTVAQDTGAKREKVVVIMGPTGSGKTKLSIELATRFNGEIINADKIQLYKGLDITTNKIPVDQQNGIVHHLLGKFDSALGEVTQAEFSSLASSAISSITGRHRLPILVGGSNSYIYPLLSAQFDPNVFTSGLVSQELRYQCCLLCMNVSPPVLNEYLGKRVDDMIDSGMVDELAEFYESKIHEWAPDVGLRKAIGVPEFERYFHMKGNGQLREEALFEEAVRDVKENTYGLARRQMEKIQRLRMGGWNIHMLNGTTAFMMLSEGSNKWLDAWKRDVVTPSFNICGLVLFSQGPDMRGSTLPVA